MKVLLVDARKMVADSLVHTLSDQAGVTAACSVATVAETRDAVVRFAPSVVIVDWALPDGDGVAALEAVRSAEPTCPVVVLADLSDASAVTAALAAGCDGFVTRDRGIDELVAALEAVGRGEHVLSPAATAALARGQRADADAAGEPRLSDRELEIVGGLARGLTNRAIADELFLSVHTVRNHVQRICRRLGASSRLEVVVIAAREGLVELTPSS